MKRHDPLGALQAAASDAAVAVDRDELLDAEELAATVEALSALQPRLRLARLDAAIRELIARRPGISSNTIALAVSGDKALVLRRLRELETRGLISHRDRSRRGREWYGQKTTQVEKGTGMGYLPLAGEA